MMKRKNQKNNQKRKTKLQKPPKKILTEHINELRNRLLVSFLVFALASITSYMNRDVIVQFLIRPLGKSVYYTSPAGAFEFVLKISLLAGLIISIPFILYQIFAFVSPAFKKSLSIKFITFIIIASSILASLGALVAYFIGLPAALHFLGSFSSKNVSELILAQEYLSFVVIYIAGFAILFQIPLIIFVLCLLFSIPLKFFIKVQFFVILSSFILAAIITPTPDIFNQLLIALPIIILYYGSIIAVLIVKTIKKYLLAK